MNVRHAMIAAGLAFAAPIAAHEGVEHHDLEVESPALQVPPAARPHRLADGSLQVPKPVQHLLGLRTELAASGDGVLDRSLLAEVSTQPEAGVLLAAPQSGRLEAAAQGWPVAGQSVNAGETLAWLRPVLTRRDDAQRQAWLADIDQKLAIAQLNLDRVVLQTQANQGQVAPENIYFEQASADLKALQKQRELIAAGLSERLPLKASRSGRLIRVSGSPGDAVVAGQNIFQWVDTSRLRLIATVFDPELARNRVSAQLPLPQGQNLALRVRGIEPQVQAPGWLLSLDPVDDTAVDLQPGETVRIVLQQAQPQTFATAAEACVQDVQGHAEVWLHVAAERFTARPVESCTQAGSVVQPGDRLVVAGATLLNQYH